MKHNWEYKRLGDVCEMKSGSIISADELAEGYMYPCFGGNGIRGFIEKYSHDGNYCIIGRVGALCGNVHQFDGKFYATEHAIVVKPIHIQNVRWLYYELYSLNLRKMAKGAAQPVLSVGTLNAIKIPVPPMEVQEQIVAELDKINELIEAKREQLKLLDLLAQSLFYDTFGDPVTNPKGWPVNQMSSVCELVTDGTHFSPKSLPEGDYMYISAKNIKKDGLDLSNVTFVDAEIHKSIYRACPVKKGDILYIKDGATTGIAIINPIEDEFSLLSSVALLRANQRYICPIYLRDFLNCPTVYQLFRTRMGGAAITRLTLKKINSFKIPIPPILLQEEYTTKVEAIEAQKATVEKSIAELQTLLDNRMDYWFN